MYHKDYLIFSSSAVQYALLHLYLYFILINELTHKLIILLSQAHLFPLSGLQYNLHSDYLIKDFFFVFPQSFGYPKTEVRLLLTVYFVLLTYNYLIIIPSF